MSVRVLNVVAVQVASAMTEQSAPRRSLSRPRQAATRMARWRRAWTRLWRCSAAFVARKRV